MNLQIPIITDETGQAIAAAISQTDVAQARIAEINAAAQQIYDDLDENYPNYSQVLAELQNKTEKVQIDYEGGNVFKLHDQTLNYADIYRLHIESPDFAFIQHGNRAYLLSYVQDDPAYMREMRFESVIATTESNLSFVKTSGIHIKSSDGINIASVDMTDINSENKAYKATVIDDSHKNDVWYPSAKAVADYVDPIKEDLNKVSTLKFKLNTYSDTNYTITDKLGKYINGVGDYVDNVGYNSYEIIGTESSQIYFERSKFGYLSFCVYNGTPSSATLMGSRMRDDDLPTAENPYSLPSGYYAVISIQNSDALLFYSNYKNLYLTNEISLNSHQFEQIKETYIHSIIDSDDAVTSKAIRDTLKSLSDETHKSGALISVNDAVSIPVKLYSGLADGEQLVRCGINVWDEQWENGYYDQSTGNPVAFSNRIRSKNPITVVPNKTMYVVSSGNVSVLGYALDGTYKGVLFDAGSNGSFTVPSDVYVIKLYCSTAYGSTYKHDTCISFKFTEYVPANISVIDDGDNLTIPSGDNYIYGTKASNLNITYYKKPSEAGASVIGLMPKIKLLSYNIRCLRGGTYDAGYDALTDHEISTTLDNFKELFQKIQPDVFVVCEDRAFFDTGCFEITGGNRSVYSELFEHYFPYSYNRETGANEPHIYSKYPLSNSERIAVAYGESVTDRRRPVASSINVNGYDIYIVGCHPMSDASAYESNRVPYNQAVVDYASDKDYVIVCGDMNTDTATPKAELTVYENAGFVLGNMGYFGTKATYRFGTLVYLDNIMAKGLTINNFVVGTEEYSDHYPVYSDLNIRL